MFSALIYGARLKNKTFVALVITEVSQCGCHHSSPTFANKAGANPGAASILAPKIQVKVDMAGSYKVII
jgi:hypothetical protein